MKEAVSELGFELQGEFGRGGIPGNGCLWAMQINPSAHSDQLSGSLGLTRIGAENTVWGVAPVPCRLRGLNLVNRGLYFILFYWGVVLNGRMSCNCFAGTVFITIRLIVACLIP